MSGFFEDYTIGDEVDLGSHEFTRDNIISFAQKFDPQKFHVDEEAAKDSLFGGLCASGWHTGSVWLGLVVTNRQRHLAEIAASGAAVPRIGPSPGVRDLKWLKPVYPGDVIAFRSTIVDKKDSRSRLDYGLVVSRHEGVNQNGESVISLQGSILIERREPRSA